MKKKHLNFQLIRFLQKIVFKKQYLKDRINGVTQEGHKRIKFRTTKNMFSEKMFSKKTLKIGSMGYHSKHNKVKI